MYNRSCYNLVDIVYGLGANALDANAVLRIFHFKGRPLTDPVIGMSLS